MPTPPSLGLVLIQAIRVHHGVESGHRGLRGRHDFPSGEERIDVNPGIRRQPLSAIGDLRRQMSFWPDREEGDDLPVRRPVRLVVTSGPLVSCRWSALRMQPQVHVSVTIELTLLSVHPETRHPDSTRVVAMTGWAARSFSVAGSAAAPGRPRCGRSRRPGASRRGRARARGRHRARGSCSGGDRGSPLSEPPRAEVEPSTPQ